MEVKSRLKIIKYYKLCQSAIFLHQHGQYKDNAHTVLWDSQFVAGRDGSTQSNETIAQALHTCTVNWLKELCRGW